MRQTLYKYLLKKNNALLGIYSVWFMATDISTQMPDDPCGFLSRFTEFRKFSENNLRKRL